ncbi:MAG: putative DNA-binding domain-containing protein [Sinobacteraceae bacterium]|nr:putative DNA-binding domain-containing protein [Nevskiaceae bacterium]
MRLAELQNVFQRYLLEGDETIAGHVTGTTRVPVRTRLAIYGEGYQLRLAEALEHSFPTLLQLMGAEEFAVLAHSYIQRFPSVFRSVRYYGDQLPAFLAAEPRYAAIPFPAEMPFLAEMARWEWAMANVFDAADGTPIDINALTAVEPESWAQLRFAWSAALEVMTLCWNVAAIWKSCSEGEAAAAVPAPTLLEPPGDWLLWRKELQIYFRPLSATEAQTLAAARAGESFGELCERLCGQLDEEAASLHAASFLRGWVESGLIIAVQVPQQGA